MWLLQLTAGLTSPGIEIDTSNLYLVATKVMLVLISLFYTLFAFLIIRQVQLMRNTVKTQFSLVLLIISILHAFASTALFLYLLAL